MFLFFVIFSNGLVSENLSLDDDVVFKEYILIGIVMDDELVLNVFKWEVMFIY